MKIYILIYSKYRIKFILKFKIRKKKLIMIFIKKKIINYYNNKKNIVFNNIKNNLIMSKHDCDFFYIIHSIKHFLKINHNSYLENKINEIF